jgi:hydroxypyruvate reductase
VLHAGERTYALADFQQVLIVAVGKAAGPMSSHFAAILSPHLATSGLVVGPPFDGLPEGFEYIEGSHPLPDARSRRVADAALSLARSAAGHSLVIWLISGGASAMMDAPMNPAISTDEMSAFHRGLVHSGLSIGEMNALRKHFSLVKGGRLAAAASAAKAQLTVLVSDVPEGQLDVIGSGPTLPDSSTRADCWRLLRSHPIPMPDAVLEWFGDALPETPKAGDPVFDAASSVVLASSETLCEHASRIATTLGFRVFIDNTCDEWNYDDAARYLADKLLTLRQSHPRVALISAGELSVPITGPSGIGGRNQHFALHAAGLISGPAHAVVLSGGSDGIDGNSTAAGAVVDESTWAQAADAQQFLDGFDSGSLLSQLDLMIETGPTGNNLRDLRILLAAGDASIDGV